ncbi:MAG: hypothetical protein B7X41_17090 [Microbacterium sp. 14-71-5]|nr:MAG: hypothetical protein B7X41_17090 [Microbacterium sp. 14-71-5]
MLASLAELDIDRRDQVPTRLTEDLVRRADVVIALKPGLDLPGQPRIRSELWALPDPAGWDVDGIRPLRNHLDDKVHELIDELVPDPTR